MAVNIVFFVRNLLTCLSLLTSLSVDGRSYLMYRSNFTDEHNTSLELIAANNRGESGRDEYPYV